MVSMALLLNKIVRANGDIEEYSTLKDLAELQPQAGDRTFAGILEPSRQDLESLAALFNLHPLAIEDSEYGHQRAKIDRYGDTYFLVLRPIVYLDDTEEIRLGETHLFVGPHFMIWLVKDSLRSAEKTRAAMNQNFNELVMQTCTTSAQTMFFLHGVLDSLADSYYPVIDGLENDGDEIEDTLFSTAGEASEISQRIYSLLNEVANFKRAVKPLVPMLDLLMGRLRLMEATGRATGTEEGVELIRLFRDVHDHVLQVNDRVDDLRVSLENALAVNSTIVAERQNDDMKRISAWAAILVVPTVIGSIYGMNFDSMPELHWTYGYPASLGLMALVSFILWVVFHKKGWL